MRTTRFVAIQSSTVEAPAVNQWSAFRAAVQVALSEGFVPAPEQNYEYSVEAIATALADCPEVAAR